MNLIIKKIKKLFSVSAMLVIAATTITTTVSCQRYINHDSFEDKWDAFEKAAEDEAAINIVNTDVPTGWENSKAEELVIWNIKITPKTYTIELDILRNFKNSSTDAVFQIIYIFGNEYSVGQWVCILQPKDNDGSWDKFKINALTVTPTQLLESAEEQKKLYSFKWTYGTPAQIKWTENDGAEFDVYGGVGKNDPYKGMKGKPTINNNNQTVTAIISKKGKNGAYDSDPIKATIQFITGELYNLRYWKFSKMQQSQSLKKTNSIIDQQVKVGGSNFKTFESTNFMTYGNDNAGIHHNVLNDKIDDVLNRNDLPNRWDHPIKYGWSAGGTKGVEGGPIGHKYWQSQITFLVETHDLNIFNLWLTFKYFYWNGKDASAGGNAFTFTWSGVIVK